MIRPFLACSNADLLTILKHTAKQYRSIFQHYKRRNRRCWKTHVKISKPGKICDAAWHSYPLYGTKSHSIFHDFDAQCAEDTKCRFKIDIVNKDRQQLTSFAPNMCLENIALTEYYLPRNCDYHNFLYVCLPYACFLHYHYRKIMISVSTDRANSFCFLLLTQGR